MTPRDALLRCSDAELLRQCHVDRYRASGPGGQKRNKTESAVRVRHEPTGLIAHASESRSQHENRARALSRLREKIALELREDVDPAAVVPARDLIGRIRGPGDKTRRSPEYLTGVAVFLDALVACGCSLGDAARLLGVSTGSLSRFVMADDHLARKVNELRASAGLRPLR